MPVWTSSKISTVPFFVQASRSFWKYSAGAVLQPAMDWMGSRMTAAVFGPSAGTWAEGDEADAGHERLGLLAVLFDAGGGDRAGGAAVEAGDHGDHFVAAGVAPRILSAFSFASAPEFATAPR